MRTKRLTARTNGQVLMGSMTDNSSTFKTDIHEPLSCCEPSNRKSANTNVEAQPCDIRHERLVTDIGFNGILEGTAPTCRGRESGWFIDRWYQACRCRHWRTECPTAMTTDGDTIIAGERSIDDQANAVLGTLKSCESVVEWFLSKNQIMRQPCSFCGLWSGRKK